MQRQEFRHLISVEDARKLVDSLDIPTRTQTIPLIRTCGSYLAEHIYSTVDVPAFSRASMDGYAVIASDTYAAREDAPVALKIIGSIAAGDTSTLSVIGNSAVDIATGAVMPAGANAVVMVEYTDLPDGNGSYNGNCNDNYNDTDTVLVKRAVSPNENIMHAGSDIMVGEMILSEGTHITSREIGVLAAVGLAEVAVRCMRIGIVSTGNELAAPGTILSDAKIYDSNSYAIAAAAKECGAQVVLYGIVSDSFDSMRDILTKASAECDLILTSGGTSAGTSDILHKHLEVEGEILAHGINIKPGKPVVIARYHDTIIFGLPGYPTSALTIFNEFVASKIKACLNPARTGRASSLGSGLGTGKGKDKDQKDYKEGRICAILSEDVRSDGRMSLQPVSLVRGRAYPVHKGSGAVTTLTDADGFIEIPADIEYVEEGTQVYVTPFGHVETPDLLFVGSNCLGLDVLRRIMPVTMRVINAGSTGGISAIRHKRADIAGIHLLAEDGTYNLTYAKDIPDTVLIKGYVRDQGFIMRDDAYQTAQEVLSNMTLGHLTLINRNAGSGTRILLDSMLKTKAREDGIDFATLCEDIRGYDSYARTHSAVASYVKLGKADVGVGIRSVATMHGLHFIDLRCEEYDFLMCRDVLESDLGRCFIESLKSKEFADSLPEGLKVSVQTGEIVDNSLPTTGGRYTLSDR